MNARRATWILLAVVTIVCLGLTELGLRAWMFRFKLLDPAEDAYWYYVLRIAPPRTNEGQDVVHDPQLGWRMRPSHERSGAHTNAAGMRGTTEYSVERVPDKKRIVVLGDSYAYGLGVGDADTFSAILEASRDDLEVLDCGANGWGTDQSVLDYELHRKKYDPDLIVVGIYEDDFNRNGVSAREYLKPRFVMVEGALQLTNVPIVPPEELDRAALPRFERPRLYDASRWIYQQIKWRATGEHQLDASFEDKSIVLRGILARLKTLAAEDGRQRPILVLTWPTMFFERGYDSVRIRARVLEIAKELELPADDLYEALRARQDEDGLTIYEPSSAHWSRAGHEVAAERIRRHLEAIDF